MFPWFARALNNLPKWIVERLAPQARVFDEFDHVIQHCYRTHQRLMQILQMTLENVAIAKQAKISKDIRDPFRRKYPSLFDWIVNSDMPESELADQRLANEAQVIQSAGSTSTARTLTHITYHVLANERIRVQLEQEVASVMAGWPEKIPSWVDLEGVPYLQAVLKEGLR